MVWSPFDRRPPARAVPAGFRAPPRLPAEISYAFRSSPYQAYPPPCGLLTADLHLPTAPVSGGLLDPVNADRLPGEEALEEACAKAGPLPESLRGIAPGPEGGLLGMTIQEFWPEEADRGFVVPAAIDGDDIKGRSSVVSHK